MSFRDWLASLGPMLVLKIPILGRKFGKPRVEIGAHDPPDADMLDRIARDRVADHVEREEND